jgi:hypothetical protein
MESEALQQKVRLKTPDASSVHGRKFSEPSVTSIYQLNHGTCENKLWCFLKGSKPLQYVRQALDCQLESVQAPRYMYPDDPKHHPLVLQASSGLQHMLVVSFAKHGTMSESAASALGQ